MALPDVHLTPQALGNLPPEVVGILTQQELVVAARLVQLLAEHEARQPTGVVINQPFETTLGDTAEAKRERAASQYRPGGVGLPSLNEDRRPLARM